MARFGSQDPTGVAVQQLEIPSFEKAQEHLRDRSFRAANSTPGAAESGPRPSSGKERDSQPEACDAPILYTNVDGTGVPLRKEELAGRKGQQPDGSSTTRLG